MTGIPPRGKPPHDVRVIGRWLGEASTHTGIAAGRLRRWVGFMVVAAMLDKSRHAGDGEPLFLVKGGVAMELRVDTGARATKDLDTAFRESMEAVGDHLDPALHAGYGDFTATRTELQPVRDTGQYAATSSSRTAASRSSRCRWRSPPSKAAWARRSTTCLPSSSSTFASPVPRPCRASP